MSIEFADKDHITRLIRLLIRATVEIKDETGEFLLRLPDGRVIDTKGWDGWEWTHGVGLYGLWTIFDATGDRAPLDIALGWFERQLPKGTTKNVNTMAPFLTAAFLQAGKYGEYTDTLVEWSEWVMKDMLRTEGKSPKKKKKDRQPGQYST
jgi:unsaturated rhamnogalacturonyl hydrolase